jgi:formate hydrogenlyase subunit 3/multisubunit Na+/H+ antiporter MnhD subunit
LNDLVLPALLLAGGGALALLAGALGRGRLAARIGAAGAVAGAGVGLLLALGTLVAGRAFALRAAFPFPRAELFFAVDPLSAFFLLPIFGLGGLIAVYAVGYFEKDPHLSPLGRGALHLLYNGLILSMAGVVTARNAYVFLFAWECMTLSAFLLVAFDDRREEVRAAARLYVVLSHLATMFAIAFFLVLGRDAGSYDLAALAAGAARRGPLASAALFACALVGFGTKAGIAPLHFWLPRAHPAAPSPVSAVMSGAIVKTALYALFRAILCLGPQPASAGYVLLALGAASAMGGILNGFAQKDLKRLLAYSTIENVGIVLMGAGIGTLGAAHGSAAVAALGWAGALLHVLHHAAMKGLLFAGAGAALHATGTRSIERLGGLMKAMPVTGLTFVAGALAIAGLPGLAGFASEWLVYAGLFRGGIELGGAASAAAIAAIPALAVTGGLAAAALAKAAGLAFLGAPRTEAAAHAHEAPPAMVGPLAALAGLCVAFGLAPALVVRAALPAAAMLAGAAGTELGGSVAPAVEPLARVSLAALFLYAAAGALALLRRRLLTGRTIRTGATWGCGYGSPGARMQYTGTSFALPLVRIARGVLLVRRADRPPAGYLPSFAARSSAVDDPAETRLFLPAARRAQARLLSLRWLQAGRIQLYLLYIFVALVGLLVWQILAAGGNAP